MSAARARDVGVGESLGASRDAVDGQGAVEPIAPRDAARLELRHEARGGGDARGGEGGGGGLQERGGGGEEVDPVELRDVGVDGVDEGNARARAQDAQGDVAEQVRHHDHAHGGGGGGCFHRVV